MGIRTGERRKSGRGRKREKGGVGRGGGGRGRIKKIEIVQSNEGEEKAGLPEPPIF